MKTKKAPKTIDYPFVQETRFGKVKIYRNVIVGRPRYVVAWVTEDGRQKRVFTSEIEAHQKAEEIIEDQKKGVLLRQNITSEKAAMIAEYENLLKPYNATLGDAVRFYVANKSQHNGTRAPVKKAAEEFLKDQFEDVTSRHYKTTYSILKAFWVRHDKDLTEFTASELDKYFKSVSKNGRTRNNHLGCIRTFFKWAQKYKKYLPSGDLEVDLVKSYPEAIGTPDLFTPEEMQTLLNNADDKLIPYLAIGAFAGVRTAEICRLDWERHIDFKEKVIMLTPDITKTGRRRIAVMTDNLVEWLNHHKGEKKGPVVPRSVLLFKDRNDLEYKTKIKWKHNALRKGYISYRMAQPDADAALVAKQCGNSADMVEENYKSLVAPSEATKWFSILPQK